MTRTHKNKPNTHLYLSFIICFYLYLCTAEALGERPELPVADAEVAISAQEWDRQPGPRTIQLYVRYPHGRLDGVTADTGLMLSLHNWGGTGFRGTADPAVLTARYNVVAIGVDYLQSGPYNSSENLPYDFGWLQALDAIRGLAYVWHGLEAAGKSFDKGRIYVTGGSGGGNVALMANKLAPRTFACVVDLSGMAKLADDIAFGETGRSSLNAGYSRNVESGRYLSPDAQALRFVGHPDHAKVMKRLGNAAKTVVVHGVEDKSCPADDAREMANNLSSAGLDIEPHFITRDDVDGYLFKDCAHSLGDRTRIVQQFADAYLLPDSATSARRAGPSDFECRDEAVRYLTPNGAFVISYLDGYPAGRFEAASSTAP